MVEVEIVREKGRGRKKNWPALFMMREDEEYFRWGRVAKQLGSWMVNNGNHVVCA